MGSAAAPFKVQGSVSPSGSLVPKSKYLLAIALVTFVVGLLQATDIVELPFGSWFST
jgi:hypothetical protein